MIRRIAPAILALASVAGCGGRGATTPTPPPSPRPDSTSVSGEITIASISPAPGATVHVRPCAEGSPRFCADHPQVTLEVLVDQDIPNAVLTVSFGGCGSAWTSVRSLTAGVRTPLSTSVIDLSGDSPLHDGSDATLFCELPAVSARTFVSLWRAGQPATPLLTRQFDQSYVFALP